MKPLQTINSYFIDFIGLVYPRLCLSCDTPLVKNEEMLCMLCKYDLPETNYHTDPDNPVAKHFWGRVRISQAASLYLFTSGSRVQHLLHKFKYDNQPEIGTMLGKYYGNLIKDTKPYSAVDVIVPVPLHPKKQHLRGYNQSAKFASGLSASMNVPSHAHAMKRTTFTDTQTKKTRLERWENVKRVFQVNEPLDVQGKHVLLVDDVITTGSTLEACAHQLLEAKARAVSIATIASASSF